MTDALGPAQHAAVIAAALDRMLAFVEACPDRDWYATPLSDRNDARAVGVIADHVAHAYEYIASWIREIVAGADPHLDAAVVDELNALHASRAGQLTQYDAADHLRRSGADLIALISGLSAADLDRGNGRVRRFAEIAARHPDDHRTEIAEALRS